MACPGTHLHVLQVDDHRPLACKQRGGEAVEVREGGARETKARAEDKHCRRRAAQPHAPGGQVRVQQAQVTERHGAALRDCVLVRLKQQEHEASALDVLQQQKRREPVLTGRQRACIAELSPAASMRRHLEWERAAVCFGTSSSTPPPLLPIVPCDPTPGTPPWGGDTSTSVAMAEGRGPRKSDVACAICSLYAKPLSARASASGAMHRRDGAPLPRNDSLASGSGSDLDVDEKTLDAGAIEELHKAHPHWATPIKVLVRCSTCASLVDETRTTAPGCARSSEQR